MNQIWLNAVRSSSAPWYLSGGAPTPVAAYTFKGAASQSASYVNQVNPGTYDLMAGVAPTWDATNGLIFNGSTQYLTTGVTPGNGWSVVFRFSNASTAVIIGQRTSALNGLYLSPNSGAGTYYYNYGDRIVVAATPPTNGVMGIAGATGYLNGVAAAGTLSATITAPYQFFLGCLNTAGTPGVFSALRMQSFAIWNTNTGHATWMPAVSAAAAVL